MHLGQILGTTKDDKDLIYEGIATQTAHWSVLFSVANRRQRPDLRRDCDAAGAGCAGRQIGGRQRPDLRRDCDFQYPLNQGVFQDDKDLIYEGIATVVSLMDVI